MKKEAFSHPKVDDLAEELGCEFLTAIGVVASLWSIPQRVQSCLSGFVPWKPSRIARFIRWEHNADTLVHALLKVRLLDKADHASRTRVEYAPSDPLGDAFGIHDWNQHAPGWVRRECKCLWPQPVAATTESIAPSTPNGLVNPSVKEKVEEKVKGLGLGVQGEGEILWPNESMVRRWPTERGFCREVVVAQHRAVTEMLSALPASEAAFAWGGLSQEWGAKGVRPADALKAILADMEDVRSPLKVIRHRLAGAGLALDGVSGKEPQFDTTKNGTRRRAS